jgi:hypothetical protein
MGYLLGIRNKVSLFFIFLCYCPDFAKPPVALPGRPIFYNLQADQKVTGNPVFEEDAFTGSPVSSAAS